MAGRNNTMSFGSSGRAKPSDRPVFRSDKSRVSASQSVEVAVDLKLEMGDIDIEAIIENLANSVKRISDVSMDSTAATRLVHLALKDAITSHLGLALSEELDEIVAAYRNMLERRVPSGQDEAIARALNRVKLRTELLSTIPKVDQAQACALLNLSDANPSATLTRYEVKNKILRVDWKGKAAYPLFQFDETEGRIYPALLKILDMRRDDWGGRIALLHWLTRPNRSLGGAPPCDRLSDDTEAVIDAFAAEVAESLHG